MESVDSVVSVFYCLARVKTLKSTGENPFGCVDTDQMLYFVSTKHVACLNAEDSRTRVQLSSPPPLKTIKMVFSFPTQTAFKILLFNISGNVRVFQAPVFLGLIRQSPFRYVYFWIFPSISIFGYIWLHIWLHGFLRFRGFFGGEKRAEILL